MALAKDLYRKFAVVLLSSLVLGATSALAQDSTPTPTPLDPTAKALKCSASSSRKVLKALIDKKLKALYADSGYKITSKKIDITNSTNARTGKKLEDFGGTLSRTLDGNNESINLDFADFGSGMKYMNNTCQHDLSVHITFTLKKKVDGKNVEQKVDKTFGVVLLGLFQ